jgi:hypothetical protein
MAKDQYRLHPAADIFRDQLLSKVDDENQKLRGTNRRLESVQEIFTNVKLHLHGGYVMSTTLTRSFVTDCHVNRSYDVCIPVDENEMRSFPLLNFSDGTIQLMGQTMGTLPGHVTLLGIHTTGTIFMRFSLSGCAVEGALRNLTIEDFRHFVDKSYSNAQINMFLETGVGLQNATSMAFTPMTLLLEISPTLQRTLEFINQRPSLESAKNDLLCHVAGRVTRRSRVLFNISRDGSMSDHNFSSESEDMIISTVAAVGYTNEILELLAENHLLKYDHCGLCKMQEMIDMVEITHPGFNLTISLGDGKLYHCPDGRPFWRVSLTTTETSTSIREHSLSTTEIFLAGMPFILSSPGEVHGVDLSWIWFYNETTMSCHIRVDYVDNFPCTVDITVDFPLYCLHRILRVLGIDV